MSLELYQLGPEYAVLGELPLEAEEGEDETGSLCRALEAIRDEARDKALSLAKVVKALEAEIGLLEQHTRLLQSKTQARRDRADFLKQRIRLELEAAGLDKVKDALITVWLQQSPPSVQVLDAEAVPAEYQRAVLRLPLALVPEGLRGLVANLDVDRVGILANLKSTGELPPGVDILSGERHVRIR